MIEPVAYDLPLRSVCLAIGGHRVDPTALQPECAPFLLPGTEEIDAFWAAVEPLTLTLALAGYRCPQIVIETPTFGGTRPAAGRLVLAPDTGNPEWEPHSWIDDYEFVPAAGTRLVVALRAALLVRSGLDAPFPPPITLFHVGAWEDLAGEEWIVLQSASADLKPDVAVVPLATTARDELVTALGDAWAARAEGVATGLLQQLDPAFWEPVRERDVPLGAFRDLWRDIWAWVTEPSTPEFLGVMLLLGLADEEASIGTLRSSARSQVSIDRAVDALERRFRQLRPRDGNLKGFLDGLRRRPTKQHWLLTLLVLHEYGLVPILPFPFTFDSGIERIDLTGWYESTDDAPTRATLQLNLAGSTLSGWWLDDELEHYPLTALAAAGGTRFTGTAMTPAAGAGEPPIAVAIDIGAGAEATGPELAVTVTFGARIVPMLRRDRLARLSTLDRFELLHWGQGMPTGPEQFERLHQVTGQAIVDAAAFLTDEVRRISGYATVNWYTQLAGTEPALRQLLVDGGVIRAAVEFPAYTPMLRRLRTELRNCLSQATVADAGGLNAWSQLLSILAEAQSVDEMHPLGLLLDVAHVSSHDYAYQFGGVGPEGGIDLILGVELGAQFIAGTLSHSSTCAPKGVPPASHGWDDYVVGITGELGGAIGEEVKGAANWISLADPDGIVTTTEWVPDDFAPPISNPLGWPGCVFGVLEVTESGAAYFYGGISGWNDSHSVVAFLSLRTGAIATGKNDGWHVAIGTGMGGGYTNEGSAALTRFTYRYGNAHPGTLPPPQPLPLSVAADAALAVSFVAGTADLTPDAVAHVALAVARYRALFASPTSELAIEGVGDPGDDGTLAVRRGVAVYSLIRTLLSVGASGGLPASTALAIPDRRVELPAPGTLRPLIEAAVSDATPADWDRLRFVVAGRAMVVV